MADGEQEKLRRADETSGENDESWLARARQLGLLDEVFVLDEDNSEEEEDWFSSFDEEARQERRKLRGRRKRRRE